MGASFQFTWLFSPVNHALHARAMITVQKENGPLDNVDLPQKNKDYNGEELKEINKKTKNFKRIRESIPFSV